MKAIYIVEDLTDQEAKEMEEAMKCIAKKYGIEVKTQIITMEEAQKEEGIRI